MHAPSVLAAFAATIALGAPMMAAPAADAGSAAYRLNRVTAYDGTSTIARWNPCQSAITYRVHVAGLSTRAARRSATTVTRASVARIARATGMPFRFRGRTSVIPRQGGLSSEGTAEIVIAFVRPSQANDALAGSTAGYSGWQTDYAPRRNGTYAVAITRAFIVIDHPQTRTWPNGVRRRGLTRPNIITHELGHAVGLDHVPHRRQLMYRTLHPASPAGLAAGDRAGLARAGRPAGCIRADWSESDLP